jgi:hypothetical protein
MCQQCHSLIEFKLSPSPEKEHDYIDYEEGGCVHSPACWCKVEPSPAKPPQVKIQPEATDCLTYPFFPKPSSPKNNCEALGCNNPVVETLVSETFPSISFNLCKEHAVQYVDKPEPMPLPVEPELGETETSDAYRHGQESMYEQIKDWLPSHDQQVRKDFAEECKKWGNEILANSKTFMMHTKEGRLSRHGFEEGLTVYQAHLRAMAKE